MSTSHTRSTHNPLLLWRPLVVASAILALSTLSGCAGNGAPGGGGEPLHSETARSSAESPAQSERIDAPESITTPEAPAEVYEGEPTREWVLTSNYEAIAANDAEWDGLSPEDQKAAVFGFLKDNYPELDTAFKGRSKEDVHHMADMTRMMFQALMEVSVNSHLPNVEKAIPRLVEYTTSTEKTQKSLTRYLLDSLKMEQEAIGSSEEVDIYREIRKRRYMTSAVMEYSDEVMGTSEEKFLVGQVYYNNERKDMPSMTVLYGEITPEGLRIKSYFFNGPDDPNVRIINLGGGKRFTFDEAWERIPQRES